MRDALDAAHAGSRAVNATSLARQMAPGAGLLALKPVLAGALDRLAAARGAALAALATLRARVAALDPALVAAAGACGRCRGGDLGAAGAVCPHCELDRTLLALEASLFALTTRAMAGGGGRAGVVVSPEVALAAAHAAAVRRVGRGGLGEAGGGEAASGRRADGVASVEILHHPSEVERVLLLLKEAVDKKGKGRSAGADLAAAAKAGAARLASLRSAFFKVTAATLAQRAALYAADELSMATSTLVMDDGGGGVDRGSARAATGVARAELPARARALEAEAAAAHHDLGVAIGQLRYLSSLAGGGDAGGNNNPRLAAPNNPSAPPDPGACPVCHDDIEGKLSMLPCGHVLCHACAKALAKRARARAGGTWGGGRAHINCPTCRRECSVADALRVVMRGEGEEEDKEEAAPSPPSPQRPPSPPSAPAALPPSYVHPGEADLDFVDDSFGTKATAVARRVKAILAASPTSACSSFRRGPRSWTSWRRLSPPPACVRCAPRAARASARRRPSFVPARPARRASSCSSCARARPVSRSPQPNTWCSSSPCSTLARNSRPSAACNASARRRSQQFTALSWSTRSKARSPPLPLPAASARAARSPPAAAARRARSRSPTWR